MNKRVLQKEESKKTILEAATELFAERGYDSTSIREIAVKAGISLGLLYNYFKGKDELLREILLSGKQDIPPASEKQEELEGLKFLEHHVRSTFRALEQNRNFWRLYHSLRLQSEILKELENEVHSENQRVLALLTQNLAVAGSTSPSAEAVLMVATLDGISQHYLLSPNFPLQDVIIRYLVQLKNHLAA
jgi:AcrR family transcriptional regulator